MSGLCICRRKHCERENGRQRLRAACQCPHGTSLPYRMRQGSISGRGVSFDALDLGTVVRIPFLPYTSGRGWTRDISSRVARSGRWRGPEPSTVESTRSMWNTVLPGWRCRGGVVNGQCVARCTVHTASSVLIHIHRNGPMGPCSGGTLPTRAGPTSLLTSAVFA